MPMLVRVCFPVRSIVVGYGKVKFYARACAVAAGNVERCIIVSCGKPGLRPDAEPCRTARGKVGRIARKPSLRRNGIVRAGRQSNGYILIACIGDRYIPRLAA